MKARAIPVGIGYASDCNLVGLPKGGYGHCDSTPYAGQPHRSGQL